MKRYGFILAFFVLLVVPLAIHLVQAAASAVQSYWSGRGVARLVIITPHSEDIRNEFRWAFADWHKKKYGQAVQLEFLNPGGTSDIRRQLDTVYRQIRAAHAGSLPPEDQVNTGIDMVWGGGDYYFNSQLEPLGILRPLDLDPRILSDAFPQPALAGVNLYDRHRDPSGNLLPPRWVGVCLASFGIIFNPDLYRALDLQPPTTWSDLTNPGLFGSLSLADPAHSSSASSAYMIVIERAMADAQADFMQRPQSRFMTLEEMKSSPDYQSALDAGWKKGMGQLLLIAANARFFSDYGSQTPNDVAAGDAAAGMTIDFYGQVTEQTVGPDRETFIAPQNATAVEPDPIAILYGTRGQQLTLAQHFVEFLLSPQGQRLWILNPGQPDGPRLRALFRLPIRQSVYADRTGWAGDINYFDTARDFNQRDDWLGTLPDLPAIWEAAWIDDRDDLRWAYSHVLAVPDPTRRAQLIDALADLPVTRSDVTRQIAAEKGVQSDPDLYRAQERLAWSKLFAEHYDKIAQQAMEAGG
jgi:ABC-type Fe3+ transport system substrate-binding protein